MVGVDMIVPVRVGLALGGASACEVERAIAKYADNGFGAGRGERWRICPIAYIKCVSGCSFKNIASTVYIDFGNCDLTVGRGPTCRLHRPSSTARWAFKPRDRQELALKANHVRVMARHGQ